MYRYGCAVLILLIALSVSTKSFAGEQADISSTTVHQQALADLAQLADDTMGGRKPGTPGHHTAQHYLQRRFTELGLAPLNSDFRQPFCDQLAAAQTCGVNLSGQIVGTTHPQAYLVITAHYDHLGTRGGRIFNGADDNASGVAVLLAVAHAFATQKPHHSVIFVATDAEEAGLYGSKHWLKSSPLPIARIKLNLNLDMLAHGGRSQRVFILTPRRNRGLRDWLEQFKREAVQQRIALSPARLYRPHARYLARPDWRKASDHASFLSLGIDSIFMTGDTHAHYHTPSDTFTNIRPAFFLRNVDLARQLSRDLDEYLVKVPAR